mmetsp:Transcript_37571/g.56219  ORF Transcript_37571/g.56219 Transcript_37571/m.56219 type:complete len:88 (-) Transcript_37571:507-770(-)
MVIELVEDVFCLFFGYVFIAKRMLEEEVISQELSKFRIKGDQFWKALVTPVHLSPVTHQPVQDETCLTIPFAERSRRVVLYREAGRF